jgi:hypothetical protein
MGRYGSHVPDKLECVLCVAEHAGPGGREVQIRCLLRTEPEDGKPRTSIIAVNQSFFPVRQWKSTCL